MIPKALEKAISKKVKKHTLYPPGTNLIVLINLGCYRVSLSEGVPKIGDRVVVPFTIACGECFFCKRGFYSGCERSNPDRSKAEKLWGHSPAGLFGYSHVLGGYAGGQAEYLRVISVRSKFPMV